MTAKQLQNLFKLERLLFKLNLTSELLELWWEPSENTHKYASGLKAEDDLIGLLYLLKIVDIWYRIDSWNKVYGW